MLVTNPTENEKCLSLPKSQRATILCMKDIESLDLNRPREDVESRRDTLRMLVVDDRTDSERLLFTNRSRVQAARR